MRDKSIGRMHILVLRCYQWPKRWKKSLGASKAWFPSRFRIGLCRPAWIAFLPERKSAQLIRTLAAIKAGVRSVSRAGRSRIRQARYAPAQRRIIANAITPSEARPASQVEGSGTAVNITVKLAW